jgi:predicted nucleotidyltransferase
MMNFKEYAIPAFQEVFDLIDQVCSRLDVGLYLIGAQARDIHFLEKGIKPSRGTRDIDFAIMLPNIERYENVMEELVRVGFRKVKEPYRLIHDTSNTVVDILPFGEIEEQGTVKFTDRQIEVSMVGMSEVLSQPEKIAFGKTIVKVAPLSGMVILKLISYNERKERTKDLEDIKDILVNYFDLNNDRFYDQHLDLLDELSTANFVQEAAARLVGRDMRTILDRNLELKNSIIRIIETEINETGGSITRYFLSKGYFNDAETLKSLFSKLHKGLIE